ncbi:hypothetical protein ALC57_07874 [Trachymyrmex cornetzi]|uniref:Uncharacterized protein n=1 Tax=Trachymyrmex cornetzi TaxID=471704 RepID=A0A195E3V4_9HYME|nr:hypothetical protein ALC57_07874 [Trachymyrmex cornetzi]
MHHTAPWYLPWGLKLVPLPIPPGHPASGIPNPAGLHLLTPLPGIYAPEPRKRGNGSRIKLCPLRHLFRMKRTTTNSQKDSFP